MKLSNYTYKSTSTRLFLRDISEEMKTEIILFWEVEKINSSPVIAERFGVTPHIVNMVLDKYLIGKRPKAEAND